MAALGLLSSAALAAARGRGPRAARPRLGMDGWTWTTLLRRSRNRPRARPTGCVAEVDCWTWTTAAAAAAAAAALPPPPLPPPFAAAAAAAAAATATTAAAAAALLRRSRRRAHALPADRRPGWDCWTWTTPLRRSRRRPQA
jgi:hypothetical protein